MPPLPIFPFFFAWAILDASSTYPMRATGQIVPTESRGEESLVTADRSEPLPSGGSFERRVPVPIQEDQRVRASHRARLPKEAARNGMCARKRNRFDSRRERRVESVL